jgi:hypothetical protein
MSSIRIALALALGCLASSAAALDHPEEARKLSLKERNGRQSLSWSVRVPPPVAPSSNPVLVGATLEIRSQGGESASFDLPASGWTADASGQAFKWKNPAAPGGPSAVKAVTLRSQRIIKVTGKGTGITLDEAAQAGVTIGLVIGDDVYCSTCLQPRRDESGRFYAVRCPPPAACGLTPTTTTDGITSSTTTSTTLPGVCGDGVVDPGEQCDAGDPGICDDVVVPVPITCGDPSSSTACECCSETDCLFSAFGGGIQCCGPRLCQDTTGVGQVRRGACIPPSCTQASDCNDAGYDCAGGTCCAQAGNLCGVVDCCPGSGATCTAVFPTTPICCRPAGATCDSEGVCCSFSCMGGVCD